MSDFGMRMPGGRAKRASGVDVYTGLMGLAVAFLLLACVVLFMQGSKCQALQRIALPALRVTKFVFCFFFHS